MISIDKRQMLMKESMKWLIKLPKRNIWIWKGFFVKQIWYNSSRMIFMCSGKVQRWCVSFYNKLFKYHWRLLVIKATNLELRVQMSVSFQLYCHYSLYYSALLLLFWSCLNSSHLLKTCYLNGRLGHEKGYEDIKTATFGKQ